AKELVKTEADEDANLMTNKTGSMKNTKVVLQVLMSTKRSYTVAFKLEVISYVETISNRGTALYYKIDRKRVQEWHKQKKELENIKENKHLNVNQVRVLKGRGQKVIHPALKEELLKFIKERREEKAA
ncbi:12276_t:CDS:2, partial [Gigaspora rosea]